MTQVQHRKEWTRETADYLMKILAERVDQFGPTYAAEQLRWWLDAAWTRGQMEELTHMEAR